MNIIFLLDWILGGSLRSIDWILGKRGVLLFSEVNYNHTVDLEYAQAKVFCHIEVDGVASGEFDVFDDNYEAYYEERNVLANKYEA
jgi:hypothetical protein